MSSVVHDFAELEAMLRDLPPTRDGRVRVYRGQTADFPAMLASDFRPGGTRIGGVWGIALLALRDRSLGLETEPSTKATIMNFGFWFKVLAQHYGPGSPYLDVTSSPEVALWFALNKAGSPGQETQFVLAQPGLGSTSLKCSILSFSEHRDASGWFYVLDVPVWNRENIPKHGEMVDLLDGPDFVANAPRVRFQHGGLVCSEEDVDGGDLASYYACPPIEVAREFHGAPFIDRAPRHLFPAPEEDEWYARLLQAPLVPQIGIEHGLEYKQSLGVYIVVRVGNQQDAREALDRQIERLSPLTRPTLRADPDIRRELREGAGGVDPETATYMQLEIPLLIGLPPVETWNQSVLFAGLGKRVQPIVEPSGELLPAVSLENVLIELCPLERAFSELDEDSLFVSAMWLIRREHEFKFTTFVGAPRDRQFGHSPTLEIVFSAESGRFEVQEGGGFVSLLDADSPRAQVKPFFIALDILRGLSASETPDPYPGFSFGSGDDMRMLLPVRGASTRLARASSDPADLRFHFLRYADSLEPYEGPTLQMPAVASLTVKTATPYAEFSSVREVYGNVHEVNSSSFDVSLPERECEGFSKATAEFLSELFAPDASGPRSGG